LIYLQTAITFFYPKIFTLQLQFAAITYNHEVCVKGTRERRLPPPSTKQIDRTYLSVTSCAWRNASKVENSTRGDSLSRDLQPVAWRWRKRRTCI